MPTAVPIACSLTAAELPERMAQIAALGADALAASEVAGSQAVLRFRPRAGTRERLRAVVAAEARCCPFLTMRLDDHVGELVLTIEGPPDAGPVVRDLAAGFGAAPGVTA